MSPALSAAHVGELVRELAPLLVGGTVREAAALPPRDLLLVLEDPAWGGIRRLRLSAAADGPRLHLQLGRVHRHEGSTGPFFERAAKELAGATLRAIEQVRGDRLALLRFDTDQGRRGLVAELVGRHANLVLVDGSERVLEWLVEPKQKQGDARPPRLARGEPHVPPPGRAPDDPGPSVTEAFEAPEDAPRLAELAPLSWRVENALGGAAEEAERHRASKQLRERLERKLHGARRSLVGLEARERAANEAERVRQDGELLKASMHELRRGLEHVDLEDWFEPGGGPRRIALDPKRSPQENVEKVFDRYHKLLRSLESLDEERARLEERAAVLESALAELASEAEPEDVERRAVAAGVLEPLDRERGKRVQKAAPRLPYRLFRTRSGAEVLVGRSARDNDELSIRIARGNDLWLHTADAPGSHVVLRVGKGTEPGDEDVLDAAHLAIHFSPLRGTPRADVHVARRKHLHKPKGAPAGLVTLSGGRTRRVRVEPERLARLLGDDRDAR
ncbi:MAG: NFACT family protein [Planctomycetota bacterium]